MLNIRAIPNPGAIIEFSRHLISSITQYQERAQTLKAGHGSLINSWEGDGAKAYSETHSKMLQVGEMRLQQREQLANMLNAAVAPLEEAKVMQDNAIRLMEAAEILAADAAVLLPDPLTAAEGAEMEADAAAMAEEAEGMEAAAQEIVAGIATSWEAILGELIESANLQKLKSYEPRGEPITGKSSFGGLDSNGDVSKPITNREPESLPSIGFNKRNGRPKGGKPPRWGSTSRQSNQA